MRLLRLSLIVTVLLAVVGHAPRGGSVTEVIAVQDSSTSLFDVRRYRSRFYTIYTNLSMEEARAYAEHMDAVFSEYQRRFSSFSKRQSSPKSLYLFRSRDNYIRFMAQNGINAANSGGMFFVRPTVSGLATWIDGYTRSEVYQVLQHEGFHQFAWQSLGTTVPIWINEGLAQYFEDGLMVDGQVKLGMVNAVRSERIRNAILHSRSLPLENLINMTTDEWNETLQRDPEHAGLLYAQAWSVCHFLIHGEDGKYRDAFEKMLKLLSAGRHVREAFAAAFRTTSMHAFKTKWANHAIRLQPDHLTVAVEKLQFLGRGTALLHKRGEQIPHEIDDFEALLRRWNYRVVRSAHGTQTEYTARDPGNFQFDLPNGRTKRFHMSPSPTGHLPPQISAPGLEPLPTLVWRTHEGVLRSDVEYR